VTVNTNFLFTARLVLPVPIQNLFVCLVPGLEPILLVWFPSWNFGFLFGCYLFYIKKKIVIQNYWLERVCGHCV